MARIPDLRLLKKEDFDGKDQRLIEQLAFPINNFMQQVVNVFKNGVDFTNLNQQIITITVSVDSSGVPVNTIQLKNTLTTKIIGMVCINAINQSSTIRFPSAQPFVSFTQNNSQNNTLITVNNISGLSAPVNGTNSDVYELTILLYGQNIPTA